MSRPLVILARFPLEVAGFLDDARSRGTWEFELEVLGPLPAAEQWSGHAFVNVIGSDQTFRRGPEGWLRPL